VSKFLRDNVVSRETQNTSTKTKKHYENYDTRGVRHCGGVIRNRLRQHQFMLRQENRLRQS
jgi:hypothetical protein